MSHEIIPAVMPTSYDDFVVKVGQVAPYVPWVHLDVMDGIFVDSVSWPYNVEDIVAFYEMVQSQKKLPHLDTLNYEVDFMTDHPEEEIPKWHALGARRFLVHLESIKDIDALKHIILTYRKKGESEVGLVIGAETPVDTIEPILSEIDCVQLMGIARIGYQGEKFDERVFDRITYLREANENVIISVDGGVSLKTAPRLLSLGVTRLVSGSGIYNAENISQAIEELKHVTYN